MTSDQVLTGASDLLHGWLRLLGTATILLLTMEGFKLLKAPVKYRTWPGETSG
jgi:hypothetical protein